MYKVWLELKYGNPDKGGTVLSRVWDRALLMKAKDEILEDLSDRVLLSHLKDEVLGIIAKADYEKQKQVVEKQSPDKEEFGNNEGNP